VRGKSENEYGAFTLAQVKSRRDRILVTMEKAQVNNLPTINLPDPKNLIREYRDNVFKIGVNKCFIV
jgi:hypothetical protein